MGTKERFEATAAEVARDFMSAVIGTEQIVLIEEEEDGYLTGYTANYIKTYIKMDAGGGPAAGDPCRVRPVSLFREGVLADCLW